LSNRREVNDEKYLCYLKGASTTSCNQVQEKLRKKKELKFMIRKIEVMLFLFFFGNSVAASWWG
jgi:hypothetical protein